MVLLLMCLLQEVFITFIFYKKEVMVVAINLRFIVTYYLLFHFLNLLLISNILFTMGVNKSKSVFRHYNKKTENVNCNG